MKKRFTDEQVIAILRESEAGATPIKALCKKHNISEQTFFRRVHRRRCRGSATGAWRPGWRWARDGHGGCGARWA